MKLFDKKRIKKLDMRQKNDIISLSESCIPSLHPVQRNAAVAAATE